MVGLLLGVGAALLRERLDQRVRRPSDLPRRVDVPVLAAVPGRVKPRLDDVFAPFGAGGRIFNRLRNEVLASIPAPNGADARVALAGQVVVVAGASRGAASTVVAANLAAAFARTGAETVLVCAHLPDSLVDTASVNRMLGVRAVPGLSDVLAGRFSLEQRHPARAAAPQPQRRHHRRHRQRRRAAAVAGAAGHPRDRCGNGPRTSSSRRRPPPPAPTRRAWPASPTPRSSRSSCAAPATPRSPTPPTSCAGSARRCSARWSCRAWSAPVARRSATPRR